MRTSRFFPCISVTAAFTALVLGAACSQRDKTAAAPSTAAVADSIPTWLLARAVQERGFTAKATARHDFQFTDRIAASGITFVHRIVDDAGRAYKANHYDHGSALCAADVDDDGRTDVFFVSQRGSSELWHNAGGDKFTDITSSSGVRMTDAIAVGCSFADIDNDGLPDLFVSTVRHGNHLFRNQGGGRFKDITVDAGVGYVGHSSGAVFFDYDSDGLLDLLVTNVGVYTSNEKGAGDYFIGLPDAFHGHTHPERAESSILYRNLGAGRFADVSTETGLVDKSWSGDATVIDVNEDGRPDIYMLNMMGQNHLWLNVEGKSFTDATASYFPKTPWGAMGAKVFDFDGDGHLDLFVTDMHSDMFGEIEAGDWIGEASKSETRTAPTDVFPTGRSQFIFGNALYASTGAGTATPWREVSDSLGVETYWPWGPSVDDVNADGWDDVLVIGGMNFPYRYSTNSLLLNEGGKHFVHSEFTLNIEPRGDGGTTQPWHDLDCSANGADHGSKSCTTCASAGGEAAGCKRKATADHYTMIASRGSRSSVIFDVDGDGDLDIITNEFNAAPQLLISSLASNRPVNALSVRLKGTKSNRQGLGAKVTVVLPDQRRILKVMDGKSGYLAQSDLPLYFGLGSADHAASIQVRWPSGKTQIVAGSVKPGQTIVIVEP